MGPGPFASPRSHHRHPPDPPLPAAVSGREPGGTQAPAGIGGVRRPGQNALASRIASVFLSSPGPLRLLSIGRDESKGRIQHPESGDDGCCWRGGFRGLRYTCPSHRMTTRDGSVQALRHAVLGVPLLQAAAGSGGKEPGPSQTARQGRCQRPLQAHTGVACPTARILPGGSLEFPSLLDPAPSPG